MCHLCRQKWDTIIDLIHHTQFPISGLHTKLRVKPMEFFHLFLLVVDPPDVRFHFFKYIVIIPSDYSRSNLIGIQNKVFHSSVLMGKT